MMKLRTVARIVIWTGIIGLAVAIALPTFLKSNQAEYQMREQFGQAIRKHIAVDTRFTNCAAMWCNSCQHLMIHGSVTSDVDFAVLSNMVKTVDCPFNVRFRIAIGTNVSAEAMKETPNQSLEHIRH